MSSRVKKTKKSAEAPCLKGKFSLQKHLAPVKDDLCRIDARMMQQVEAFDSGLRPYVEYALASRGKRIRPALCLLAARTTGDVSEWHDELAVVVELIHLASLVHDDVLDDASLRRALPTLHAKWGPQLAVLLGDALFAHALCLGVRFPHKKVARRIADAAQQLCTGEILQTQRRFDLHLSLSEYLRVIEMKTATLFRAASGLAGFLNRAQRAQEEALYTYGKHLGIAYQIYDDCLDLFGSETRVGKTLGTDFSRGKLTLPLLHIISQLNGAGRDELTKLMLAGSSAREAIAALVVQHGGHRCAVRKAQEHLGSARRALSILPQSSSRCALEGITAALGQYLSSLLEEGHFCPV